MNILTFCNRYDCETTRLSVLSCSVCECVKGKFHPKIKLTLFIMMDVFCILYRQWNICNKSVYPGNTNLHFKHVLGGLVHSVLIKNYVFWIYFYKKVLHVVSTLLLCTGAPRLVPLHELGSRYSDFSVRVYHVRMCRHHGRHREFVLHCNVQIMT